ncbi:zinc ribbon domain-containing protein [Auritidibacter ignavus]|uniref:zinc ribbon domain-containing protein n=1 Tax=Auritidibacter ignavus TaxID=678932 RepID=UPI00109CAB10|nr:hypothetical protein [Auritidibacter ignavus]
MPVARYDTETQRRLLDLQAFDTQIATAKQRLAQLKKDPDYQQGKDQYEKFTDQLQHLNRQREDAGLHLAEAQSTEESLDRRVKTLSRQADQNAANSHQLNAILAQKSSVEADLAQAEAATGAAREAVAEVDAEISACQQQRQHLKQNLEELAVRLKDQMGQIATEGKRLTAARAELVGSLPEELVAHYQDIAQRNAGIGAMRLDGNTSASGMTLSPVELAAIDNTPADQLAYDPETGVILIRDEA